ncbi:MAG: hypothetical protein QME89_07510, partial [Actinomycetota bacterium]|nr:hypothetical protein [Actinomycetota bacterium]
AIVIAVALLILGCWLFNLTCGRGKKEDASSLSEYANRVKALVEASNGIGGSFASLRASLADLIADTENLGARLEELEGQALDLLGQVKAVVPPRSLESAHQALVICFEQRYRALKNYRPDIINAVSAMEVDVYAESISQDLRELVYSDGNYLFFRRALEDFLAANNLQNLSLPDSMWLEDWESASVNRVRSFLQALKGTEVHGVALGKITFDPAGMVVREGKDDVHRLPAVDEISVTVVVENQGNRPESGVTVTLSLYSKVNTTPVRQKKTIEELGPGEKAQLVFSGLRPTKRGVRNILEIKVDPVPKETFLDNNQKLIYFTLG